MPGPKQKPQSGTRLTGRGGGLLLLSLVVTVTGALIPEPNAVRLGLLGMLLLPATWPFARRNLRSLRVVRRLPETCFAGQLFSMDLELVNDKPRMDSVAVDLDDGIAGPAERGMAARWIRSRTGWKRAAQIRVETATVTVCVPKRRPIGPWSRSTVVAYVARRTIDTTAYEIPRLMRRSISYSR